MKSILTLIALTFCISMASFGQDSTSKATQTLPDMMVKDIDGNSINLQSLVDGETITIVSFWATWCKPCIKELTNVSALLEDWEEEFNVKLVAISVDDARNASKIKPFAAGRGWDFDIFLDPNGDVQRAMNVANPPVTFLFDKSGKVVYLHNGYQEGDEYELEDHIKEIH